MATSPSENKRLLVMKDCNEYMLDNAVDTDVKFIVEHDNKKVEIGAHKYMLISRSPVFCAMLTGNFKESSGEIIISDSEPQPFKMFLRYVYCADTELTDRRVIEVLYLGRKYILEDLVDLCQAYITDNMSADNVYTWLVQARQYNEEDLERKCLKFMVDNASDFIKSKPFLRMKQADLLVFLKCDSLKVASEYEVYDACLEWAKDALSESSSEPDGQSMREALGDCLYQIRFSAMSCEEFAKHVAKTDILTAEEKVKFFCFLSTNQDDEGLREIGFNMSGRWLHFEHRTSYRIISKDGQMFSVGEEKDIICVRVSNNIYFTEVHIYGLLNVGKVHQCVVDIWNGVKQQWVHKEVHEVMATKLGPSCATSFKLNSPLEFEANVWYKVCIGVRTPIKYNASASMRVIRHDFEYNYPKTGIEKMREGRISGIGLKRMEV